MRARASAALAARVLRRTAFLLLAVSGSLQAQLSDGFASHFGASRTRESVPLWSVSLGVMLLTQFDSRWATPLGPDYIQYGGLRTTVGYNYLSGGFQYSWPLVGLWNGTPVFSGGAIVGVTWDRLTQDSQDGLHDWRRFPHVGRTHVSDGDLILGVDVEASHWWDLHWRAIDFEIYPTAAFTFATHHREASVSAGASASFWKYRLQAAATQGWMFQQSQIRPTGVAPHLDDAYVRYEVSAALNRNRYGNFVRYLPSGGVAVAWSSGHFSGQRETLLSVFFDFPSAYPKSSVRVEAVNDAAAGKDRGPTGGARFTYVAR